MRVVRPRAILAVAAVWLSAMSPSWLSPIGDANAAGITSVPPAEYRPRLSAQKTEAVLLAPDARARRIVLPEPTQAETERWSAKRAASAAPRPGGDKYRPLVVGFPRELPGASRGIVLAELAWKVLVDGSRAARIELQSPGAAALRIALSLPSTHPDLSIRFLGNGTRAEVLGPYPANAIADAALGGGSYWSPVLEGDTAIIELHVASGAAVAGLTLVMGPTSHLVAAGAALQHVGPKREGDVGNAGACNIDIACVAPSTALTEAANSVGKVLFNDRNGTTYLCTGTLLNDSTTSFTPYLFTANHCIDDAYLASTINVYWFFRAQVCGSTQVPPYTLQTGGAMLLARSDDFDWALLRLNRAPPAGARFAAWRAESVPQSVIATGLHHPSGDLAKFSQGASPGYHEFSDGSSFIKMRWSQGTTESGSSGSALFTLFGAGGYYEVRGGLFGGDASCSVPAGLDYYSRLDNMLPLVRQYLTPDAASPTGQAVAVEFYNRTLNHYFISTDPDEINGLDTGVPNVGWERTGIRFLAYNTQTPGTNPVCRFYRRPPEHSHFYSGSPVECQEVAQRYAADWVYESPNVFYVAIPHPVTGACPLGTRPLWRFYNKVTINHRYTGEVALRDQMRQDPRWIAEGYGPDAVIMCSPTSN